MKVKELKEILNELDEDLEVRVWVDHGQTYMKADSVELCFTDEGSGEWMIEGVIDEDELEEYEEDEVHKMAVIFAG